MADRRPVLLGQALESKSSYSQDKVQLVQCFVSIVLGIQSGQINNAIEDLQEKMQRKFEDVVVKDRSKWIRGDVSSVTEYIWGIEEGAQFHLRQMVDLWEAKDSGAAPF